MVSCSTFRGDIQKAQCLFSGGANKGDNFPLVAPVNSEIFAVRCDYTVTRIELAHANQAQIRQIGFTIGEAFCKPFELWKVVGAIKGNGHQSFSDHRQYNARVLEVKSRFCQHGFAREQRLSDSLSKA